MSQKNVSYSSVIFISVIAFYVGLLVCATLLFFNFSFPVPMSSDGASLSLSDPGNPVETVFYSATFYFLFALVPVMLLYFLAGLHKRFLNAKATNFSWFFVLGALYAILLTNLDFIIGPW
ncbi:hypothetical protein HHX48_18260 [Salinimonas sp. HHU 13199]|uniref:Uncharacterized protein n=1 Tax=Salinimonas profundi TaxID=2729140 RepID=A0ABR8LQW5_9ALTE|nr:hypothetical protein [Salinimonas profundi]MBD3587685.1 hypothetical protein [Salinimonas profundi]